MRRMDKFFNPTGDALAEYQGWLNAIKQRIVSVRLRMALAASRELILFYWELGAMIAQKQTQSQWGDKLIVQLSTDLQKAFPDIKGLSASRPCSESLRPGGCSNARRKLFCMAGPA